MSIWQQVTARGKSTHCSTHTNIFYACFE